MTTLMEYLVDYATPETRAAGQREIARELKRHPETPQKVELLKRLRCIAETEQRDLYF